MSHPFLLIASRDPYTHGSARHCYQLASRLAGEGHPVTLFLVQNGVLPARAGAVSGEISGLARCGVRVLADELSLRERGIDPERLAPGVAASPLDAVIEALADGARALWH